MNYTNRLLAAVALVLVSTSPSWATNKCFISEYAKLGAADGGSGSPQIAQMPSIADQSVDFTAGSTQSSAFNSGTYYIRVWCDTQASMATGTNPTATTTNAPLAVGVAEYFGVKPGHFAAFIAHP